MSMLTTIKKNAMYRLPFIGRKNTRFPPYYQTYRSKKDVIPPPPFRKGAITSFSTFIGGSVYQIDRRFSGARYSESVGWI